MHDGMRKEDSLTGFYNNKKNFAFSETEYLKLVETVYGIRQCCSRLYFEGIL
jgi:hypothetical protein